MTVGVSRNPLLLAALALPAASLLVALAMTLLSGDVDPVPPSPSAFAAWDADGYSPAQVEPELLQRPLLWISRRPLAAVAPPVTDTQVEAEAKGPKNDALAGYRLAGVFRSEFDAGVIVVGPKARKRLVVGDEIDGWMLEDVQADTAIFVSQSGARRRATVQLEHMLAGAGNAQRGKTSSTARGKTVKEPDDER